MKEQPCQLYPFNPRSTAVLTPGHFWGIPLSDGTFGCGRVIELKPKKSAGARVTFLAGVLDWHSDTLPTPDSIAGAKCLSQGKAHLKVITETGTGLLGYRPLELDGIEPWEFRGTMHSAHSHIYRGFSALRPQRPTDSMLPVLSAWGYGVPVRIAERHFLKIK